MRNWIVIFLLALSLILVACADASPTPIPPPPTPLPTVPSLTEDAVGVVGAAAPVAIEAPTVAPPPTLAPVPTSEGVSSAPPAIEGVLTAADFGTDRNPLTGELVDDPLNLQRRPIAIKLSNAPARHTRPQSGLNDADLVFEHTTEGNITRFTAVFYDTTPEKIGPVRSARLIDIELPAMYDAALAFSGSSTGVASKLRSSDFRPRILYAWDKGFYRTEEDKPVEHTLYANPYLLWETLSEKEQNIPPTFTSTNVFSDKVPEGGSSANGITIDYNWTLVNWRYDFGTGRYRRWADGEIHADGNTDEQVQVANVIVLSPNHAFDPTICEQINEDGTCAAQSVEIQLWGTGSAALFRDGQRFDVIWHRENRGDSLTFTKDGQPFPLKIGNSWVQIVPNWLKNPMTVTP
ncbi:MAG: DUF3048 domain-containing protein [Candidatus Promineifilaceae bacterium]|nr:DUF3048 domain-containing protein [Candidatus Promineifilaceae bacterium]